jgi:hypothetical protein
VSSNYSAAIEPTADVNNLAEVARALKGTQEALILKVEELEAMLALLQGGSSNPADATAVIGNVAPPASRYNFDDPSYDAVFDRAAALAQQLTDQARRDALTALTQFRVALENFKSGLEDTNAVVKVNILELESRVEANVARVSTEELTRATATQALAGRLNTVSAATSANSAAITQEAIARADADGAIAVRVDTVEAQALDNTAAITQEAIARADADTALSAQIDTVSATTSQNSADITSIQTAYTSADQALANQINTVSAQTDAGTANGSFRVTALSNPTDGAAAEFAVQVNALSGATGGTYTDAGMRIQAFSNGTRRVKFNTDQFLIQSGAGNNFTPFAVTSGQLISNAIVASGNVSGLGSMALINKISTANIATYMDTGVISNAYIGTAAVQTANIADLSVDTLKIQGNAVTVPVSVVFNLLVVGNGDYQLAGGTALTNNTSVPMSVILLFTARVAYSSGARTTGYRVRKDAAVLGDFGTIDAINDLPSFQLFDTLAANSSAIYSFDWFAQDSTVSIGYRVSTALGVRR